MGQLAARIEIHDIGPPRPLGRVALEFPDVGAAGNDEHITLPAPSHPAIMVEACRRGIVPSPVHCGQGAWCSPDPRAVIVPQQLHVSRRLARTMRRGQLYVSMNAAFERVLAACAGNAEEARATAIYRRAYARLHRLGWAHSFETWTVGGELAGGLYGLHLGGLFSVEATFHALPEASKVALVGLVRHCRDVGVTLVDVRRMAPHLSRMGAMAIPRGEYVEWVRAVANREIVFVGKQHEPDQSGREIWVPFNTSL